MEAIDNWLHEHNARCLWQEHVQGVGFVECWALGKGVVHVTRYQRDDKPAGWDLHVPASLTNKVSDTLEGAERALGLAR